MEYKNLIFLVIPRIAESVVIAFNEIISDADFAELNAITSYNRYGMNRNELFDKVIDRMFDSFYIERWIIRWKKAYRFRLLKE